MIDAARTAIFGALELAFTDAFVLRWNDRGSGGTHDGAFWHPKPPSEFFALGTIGVSNYDNPNGKHWALCVREAQSGALAPPFDYERVWIDKGSGSDLDGSCWRPRPPSGYRAMGDVFMLGHETKPSKNDVRCVRADLVVDGPLGDLIWNDVKTGSKTDFSAWKIAPRENYDDSARGAFAANTCYGVPSHQKPRLLVPVLALPFPVRQEAPPSPPTLTSRSEPERRSRSKTDRVVTVPFTAIYDPGQDVRWKVANSPFYTIERAAYYRLELFNNNDTSRVQTSEYDVEVGISTTDSKTWEVKTGVSVTASGGVSVGGIGGSVSATVSVELGFSSTTSVSVMRSQTLKATLQVGPGKAGALWDIAYELTVKRADGVAISQNVEFAANGSFHESEFPKSEDPLESEDQDRYFAPTAV